MTDRVRLRQSLQYTVLVSSQLNLQVWVRVPVPHVVKVGSYLKFLTSLMSRTAIVAPKLCARTLVSMMVVLIVGDVLQGCVCGEYNALDSLEFKQADPVEFGELVASRWLNAEEGSRKILTHTGWELEPFSWRAQGRAKPVAIVPLPLGLLS